RWEAVTETGDGARAVLRRFDVLTGTIGLDRQRAGGWTLGRILQNTLWDIEDGKTVIDPPQLVIASVALGRWAGRGMG
ncbi:hydroxyurea phosphotransferase, partial [Streptomyces sp. ActVer]|nr:hydroxyurea phosphotransferase [Streptomyces sp. ActVer]